MVGFTQIFRLDCTSLSTYQVFSEDFPFFNTCYINHCKQQIIVISSQQCEVIATSSLAVLAFIGNRFFPRTQDIIMYLHSICANPSHTLCIFGTDKCQFCQCNDFLSVIEDFLLWDQFIIIIMPYHKTQKLYIPFDTTIQYCEFSSRIVVRHLHAHLIYQTPIPRQYKISPDY